jgi:glutamate synthase domain-containing protein 3
MAGGIMILLGIGCSDDKPITGDYLCTGMHGGVIYLRGEVVNTSLALR